MNKTQDTIVVLGMAASGRAAATLALAQGAHVIGMDLNRDVAPLSGVEMMLGPHNTEVLYSADLIIVSPGIPANLPILLNARDRGIPLVGELAYAWSFLSFPLIAVTGTNGKSTVTSFAGQLLKRAGLRVFVGGNLGTPLSCAVGDSYDVGVVEVSSYQLELFGASAPAVAAVLNLTQDHLGRHGTMEEYAKTKVGLFRNMPRNSPAFLPVDSTFLDEAAAHTARKQFLRLGALAGVFRSGDEIVVDDGLEKSRFCLAGFGVLGEHNRDNAATALALCRAFGVETSLLQKGIGYLTALPHRMEVVHTAEGVVWINDSKATNVDASLVGLRGLNMKAVVLLGGQAKGGGFCRLRDSLESHRAVVTFGASGSAIAKELEQAGVPCIQAIGLEDAVRRARGLVVKGEAVLLSPGCASFDEFKNFEHRGEVFRDLATRGVRC